MKYILALVCLITHFIVIGQQNGKWLVGQGNVIDFTQFPTNSYLLCDSFSNQPFVHGTTMICTEQGEYLFLASPYFISHNNCNYEIMENGYPNQAIKWDKDNNDGYLQMSIIVPKGNNQYYVFYKSMTDTSYKDFVAGKYPSGFNLFFYNVVDMNANNGKGKVIEKAKLLLEDWISPNALSAVRHANGRDWWVVLPHQSKHLFYTFLATSEGITRMADQSFNAPDFHASNWGQSNFSPDGSLYVVAQYGSEYIQINSFDRCSGTMSKYRSIQAPKDTVYYYDTWYQKDTFVVYPAESGVCFSEDNKYLYLVGPYEVWQYDIAKDEFINLRNDELYNPAIYVTAYNAIDGRIYLGHWNGTENSLTYIDKPLLKGEDADLCQFCLKTPASKFTTVSPPNMPNYGLGALKGSACDTIGKLQYSEVKIYPNPSNGSFTIYAPQAMGTTLSIVVTNTLGQVIHKSKGVLDSKQTISVNLGAVAKGVYFVKVNEQSVKVVVE